MENEGGRERERERGGELSLYPILYHNASPLKAERRKIRGRKEEEKREIDGCEERRGKGG